MTLAKEREPQLFSSLHFFRRALSLRQSKGVPAIDMVSVRCLGSVLLLAVAAAASTPKPNIIIGAPVCLIPIHSCARFQSSRSPFHPAFSPATDLVVNADDLGFGDIAAWGHPTSYTPNLDAMSRRGARLVQYYSAANICSPSRGSLLTGRFYRRSGGWQGRRAAEEY